MKILISILFLSLLASCANPRYRSRYIASKIACLQKNYETKNEIHVTEDCQHFDFFYDTYIFERQINNQSEQSLLEVIDNGLKLCTQKFSLCTIENLTFKKENEEDNSYKIILTMTGEFAAKENLIYTRFQDLKIEYSNKEVLQKLIETLNICYSNGNEICALSKYDPQSLCLPTNQHKCSNHPFLNITGIQISKNKKRTPHLHQVAVPLTNSSLNFPLPISDSILREK